MRIISAIALSSLVFASACDDDVDLRGNSGITTETKNRLALCGGGFRGAIGADLEGKIGKTLDAGATIDAQLYQELEAAFLRDNTVNTNVALQAYKTYVGCIQPAG